MRQEGPLVTFADFLEPFLGSREEVNIFFSFQKLTVPCSRVG